MSFMLFYEEFQLGLCGNVVNVPAISANHRVFQSLKTDFVNHEENYFKKKFPMNISNLLAHQQKKR